MPTVKVSAAWANRGKKTKFSNCVRTSTPRAIKAGVANKVKGIFWYQGESDCDTSSLNYENRFNLIYNAWHQDFNSNLKIYLIQTRPGCLYSTNQIYYQMLREVFYLIEYPSRRFRIWSNVFALRQRHMDRSVARIFEE